METIGALDPLIVGRAHLVFETGEKHGEALMNRSSSQCGRPGEWGMGTDAVGRNCLRFRPFTASARDEITLKYRSHRRDSETLVDLKI